MTLRPLLLILLIVNSVQGLKGQPYTFLNFSLADGLPQSQVLCEFTDSRAYLWLGTAGGGACRYDGEQFSVYTIADGLPSNYIKCIFQDVDYRLWIGTTHGLCRYNGQHFKTIAGYNGSISALSSSGDSILLIGTSEGLFDLHQAHDTMMKLTADPIGDISCIRLVGNTFWIGTTKGLWKLSPPFTHPEFVSAIAGQGIYAISPDEDNILWLGSWNWGIVKYNVSAKNIDTSYRDPLLQLPQCIFKDVEHQLWIGTQNNGLILVNLLTHQLTQLSEAEGLPHNNIKAIVPDENGEIWIGTSGGGISKCVKQNFRQYSKSDGLAANRIYSVYKSKDAKLWLAVGNNGIQSMDSSGLTNYRLDSLLHGAKCRTITADDSGRIWVGTEGRGILILDQLKAKLLRRQNGLQDDWIQKIVKDQKGNIWVASMTNGLSTIHEDSLHHFVIQNIPLPFLKVSSMFVDARDRIWVGSNDGRISYLENEKVSWTSTSSSGLPAVALKSIAFDRLGRIWIGTESKGLYIGTQNDSTFQFQPLSSAIQISSQNIYLVTADYDGQIWAGTETGVDRIIFDSKGVISSIKHFGKNEGFSGIETCQDASISDPSGQIWFGTMNGLMRFTPGNEIVLHTAPKIHFEKVSVLYKPLYETIYSPFAATDGGIRSGLNLAYQDNHISFDFKAVDLSHPDQIVYRWKLGGADQDWSPPTKQTGVNYAYLSPGHYKLSVQAASGDQVWSAPVEATFTIEAPYWQKKSFWFFVSFFLFCFIVLAFYLWTRRIKKREYARREKLELENRLLHLEQKALQLQMNPHFIFNALTGIKSLIGKEKLTSAQEEINAFAQLMRGVLNNSRKQAISLTEECAVLDKYLHLEQMCHSDKFTYSIQLPQGIDPDEIEIPPMLLQPFVENAVIHGISQISHSGKIEVVFAVDKDLLVCTISDNGPGREKAARLKEEKKPGHQSVAIEVTKERLEAIRSGQDYVSLVMEDILNEYQEIAGTRVIVRLPAKANW